MPRTRTRSVLLSLLLLAGASQSLRAEGPQHPVIALTAEQIRTAGIRVEPVSMPEKAQAPDSQRPAAPDLHLPGRVVLPGNLVSTVVSSVSGQLDAQFVQSGTRVVRGERLLRIRSAELAALQREYLNARSALRLAELRHERDQALYKEGIITRARLDEARAAQEMSLAAAQSSARSLVLAGFAESGLQKLTPAGISTDLNILAPSDGVLIEQPFQAGQRFEVGATLLRIASAGPWWIDLQASADQAAQIAPGDAIRAPGCAQAGIILAVGAQLDAASQTMLVRAQMPAAADCLRPNQYLQVGVFRVATQAQARIPASALVRNGTRHYIFLQEPHGFRPMEVTVTRRAGHDAWIGSGLADGMRVAVSGTAVLRGAWLGLGAPAPGAP